MLGKRNVFISKRSSTCIYVSPDVYKEILLMRCIRTGIRWTVVVKLSKILMIGKVAIIEIAILNLMHLKCFISLSLKHKLEFTFS